MYFFFITPPFRFSQPCIDIRQLSERFKYIFLGEKKNAVELSTKYRNKRDQ